MTHTKIEQWLKGSELMRELPADVLNEVRAFSEGQLSRIKELVKIGIALSAEKNLERLLEMIVTEARSFTGADGGTLYIKNDNDELDFKIIQNDSLGVRVGGPGEHITWQPVPLHDAKDNENHNNVSAHCALIGEPINIEDVYDADFDFQGTRKFDANTGYRSKSMLLVPMRGHENEVIGVLQLLNARDSETGDVVAFDDLGIDDITSLASQAAIAITNVRLVAELEVLLDAFLKVIATAIDEKSPYTGGHISNVAEITLRLAEAVNNEESGSFAGVGFSEDELAELKMAAWLHDIGKVTTPEYVVDKATKLQTIFDRIELVKSRVEILKRDVEIRKLKAKLAENDIEPEGTEEEWRRLDEMASFMEEVNVGGEFLSEDKVDSIRQIAQTLLLIEGRQAPLLTEDEVLNLCIRKGTLTDVEREIINNHVRLTHQMLAKLPFPKKLAKVPDYAAMHHEKLDGTGYPNALLGEQVPLQARILAVADVFEALTAADRPYKKGKKLSESIRILEAMAAENHLDVDVCDLLVKSGLVEDYGNEKVSLRQRDNFEWQGETYKML